MKIKIKKGEREPFFLVFLSPLIYKFTRACGTCTLDITCPRQSSRSVKKRTTSLFSFFFFLLLLILPPPTFFSPSSGQKKKSTRDVRRVAHCCGWRQPLLFSFPFKLLLFPLAYLPLFSPLFLLRFLKTRKWIAFSTFTAASSLEKRREKRRRREATLLYITESDQRRKGGRNR